MFEEETKMEDDPSHAGKTFVDLFREAVAKYPDRPAVRDGMGELTYKELDHMSDYVAQKLTEMALAGKRLQVFCAEEQRNMP